MIYLRYRFAEGYEADAVQTLKLADNLVDGCDEESAGDADRLLYIIVLPPHGVDILPEDHDQPGGCFQKGFVGICAEGFEVFEPGIRCPVLIEFTLFFFCCLPDLFFEICS